MLEKDLSGANTTITLPDILYKTIDTIPLYLDMIRPESLPEEPMAVILYLHEGAWLCGNRNVTRPAFLAA